MRPIPVTLEAGRDQWTLVEKLARLIEVAQGIGYGTDSLDACEAEMSERQALWEELAAALEDGANAEAALYDREDQLRHAYWERDEARQALEKKEGSDE